MFRRLQFVLCLAIFGWLGSAFAASLPPQKSSITFVNRSGAAALVKLVGPTRHTVEVADGGSRAVNIAGGHYHLLVRYGSEPKQYRYTKGEAFEVLETASEYEEITITLHTVAGGNYDAQPSSPDEFAKGE